MEVDRKEVWRGVVAIKVQSSISEAVVRIFKVSSRQKIESLGVASVGIAS